MPNKSQTGDASLGANSIGGATNDPATGFIRTEQELKRHTPLIAPTAGKWTMPNGIMHLPDRRRRGGGGGDVHPWKVKLSYDAGLDSWTSTISMGIVCKYLMPTSVPVYGNTEETVTENTVISLEAYDAIDPSMSITYTTEESLNDFVPQQEIGGDIVTKYPLAYIVNNLATQQLEVRQLARSNFWLMDMCYNGQKIEFLTPI